MSRPARGVWVEINATPDGEFPNLVTSRKGRVSRNVSEILRKSSFAVTSRKGRVSRNRYFQNVLTIPFLSRPARGVWVEIVNVFVHYNRPASRPARGVWVEIFACCSRIARDIVTSRKGRVSRNLLLVLQAVQAHVTSRKGRVSRNI